MRNSLANADLIKGVFLCEVEEVFGRAEYESLRLQHSEEHE